MSPCEVEIFQKQVRPFFQGLHFLQKIIVFSTEVKLYDLGSVYLYVCRLYFLEKLSLYFSPSHFVLIGCWWGWPHVMQGMPFKELFDVSFCRLNPQRSEGRRPTYEQSRENQVYFTNTS